MRCTLNVPQAHSERNKKIIWITMWIAWARLRAFDLINWEQLWRRKSDFYLFHFIYGRWSAFAVIWYSKNISTVNIFKEDICGCSLIIFMCIAVSSPEKGSNKDTYSKCVGHSFSLISGIGTSRQFPGIDSTFEQL